MKSISTIYKVGNGPSSSHTVGPYNAAKYFLQKYPKADSYRVVLYGSLALTGDGHGTDKAIRVHLPNAEIIHDKTTTDLPHPNTMDFIAITDGKEVGKIRVMSVGGGVIEIEGIEKKDDDNIYPHEKFSDIYYYCKEKNISLIDYIYEHEKDDIKDRLAMRWHTMEDCVRRGIKKEGELPGGLHLERKASILYNSISYNESSDITMTRLISAFAFAVAEENASENVVVTAPTCGACGIIPAVFYYHRYFRGFPENEIIDALAVAGLFGNIIQTNASISGAECGCQAEIGSACSMAAAGLAHLFGLTLGQIEYAAEVAMEHCLGLTCDPIKGLVQIPCIERNAVGAMRAVTSSNLARFLHLTRKISFDNVVDTMYKTGLDMNKKYKETSNGGLAELYK